MIKKKKKKKKKTRKQQQKQQQQLDFPLTSGQGYLTSASVGGAGPLSREDLHYFLLPPAASGASPYHSVFSSAEVHSQSVDPWLLDCIKVNRVINMSID